MTTAATHPVRLISVDVLKAFAVLLILNHRMQLSYGELSVLATGGALGCALFFFISGYCMAYARADSFKEWVQKRLGRLIPTVLIAAFIGNFGVHQVFGSAFMWFVHCIVVYFLAFYFIKKYAMKYIHGIIGLCCAAYAVYFIAYGHTLGNMYGATAGKYFLFFTFYLCGVAFRLKEYRPSKLVGILSCIPALPILAFEMLFRSRLTLLGFSDRLLLASPLMIMAGIIALFLATDALNSLGEDSLLRRWINPVFACIAALSLESYIGIEPVLVPLQRALAPLFPYNLPLVVIGLLLFCYFVRVCTRLTMAIIGGKAEELTLHHVLKPY